MGNFRIKHSIVMALMTCLLAGSTAWAEEVVSPLELEALKGMMQEVISENEELTKRVRELEAQMSRVKAPPVKQEQAAEQAVTGETKKPVPPPTEEVSRSIITKQERLEQRVQELETEKTVQEDATRAIIRDSISTLGSNINEFVSFGGTIEVLTGWGEDFSGESEGVLQLDTAELDFEVQVNDWTLGSLIFEFDDGTDALFPTTEGSEETVDRINIDTAFLTIGDPQRFPPFGTFGRVILPFGISTGDPVADVLTLEDPLTLEVFEMRQDAILFGLGFPTPALTPATPPVTPPPVKPLVINPLVSSLSRHLGYAPPPTRPPLPTPFTPTPAPPLFNAGFYLFRGDTFEGDDRGFSPGDHYGATVGFRTKGNCGRPYEQLVGSFVCPWTIDVDVDFNSSVFDSSFLESEYRSFFNQIGFVPGMAASVKASLGPVSLVGEWNGAIDDAKFIDGSKRLVRIMPSAWQVSLGYQLDWNPWVEAIGDQGTYLAISYSESHDLAGVTRLIVDEPTRVGSVPRRRFLVSVGEWVLDGVRFAVEYSHVWDYSRSEGGTGNSANGVFTILTYDW